ncbi:hypothetical protein FocTR4_00002410 [Fusarium oxysporum f. sp. cubense]|uniref:Uncharacterized protein n=1 Tax=Fusarium oxysporum f. sp. cubense TaxID=61366 RepID=A0A5C6TC81_FUSOC|nr:hypothetical protein FocTR4_00002410 [Fusarium oxysporum f. sp. cubense]
MLKNLAVILSAFSRVVLIIVFILYLLIYLLVSFSLCYTDFYSKSFSGLVREVRSLRGRGR